MIRFLALAAVTAVLLALTSPASAARSFADFPSLEGLERTTLTSNEGHRLDVVRYSGQDRLPAVVVIPGSLCAPIFATLDSSPPGEAFGTVPMLTEAERNSLNAHVVYLERRNIVSLETMSSAPEFSIEQILKLSPCTERNGGLTLGQRVADVLVQVRWLKQQGWVESVHLIGVSEGSDVAAGVMAADGTAASSLMLIGGAGPSQFSDFALFARSRGDTDEVSKVFSELDQFLSSTPPTQYKGSSSKRWQSFAIDNSVLDLLTRSSAPLFLAHGDQDESVPVSSADFAAIELMRKQPKRAIFYWSVVGGDHMLKTPGARRLGEAIVHYLSWATSTPSGRTFRAN